MFKLVLAFVLAFVTPPVALPTPLRWCFGLHGASAGTAFLLFLLALVRAVTLGPFAWARVSGRFRKPKRSRHQCWDDLLVMAFIRSVRRNRQTPKDERAGICQVK